MTTTTRGEPRRPAAAGGGWRQRWPRRISRRTALAERLGPRPRHDVFFVRVVPNRLHRLRRCRPPAEKPLPKSAERDLQVIVRVLPRFRVGIVVVFRRDAAAFVALPLLPPNEQRADVDRGHRRHCDR